MLKIDQGALEQMEKRYQGITASLIRFKNAELLSCPQGGLGDTASVQVGIIGRTIYIAAATIKVKLIPNGPKQGEYFCH